MRIILAINNEGIKIDKTLCAENRVRRQADRNTYVGRWQEYFSITQNVIGIFHTLLIILKLLLISANVFGRACTIDECQLNHLMTG